MSRNGAAVVSAFRLLLRPSGVSRHRGLRLAPVTAFALHLRPCGGHELQQHRTFAATTSDDDGKHPLDKHKTQLETGGLEANHAKEEVKVQEDVKTHEAESKKSDENELEVSKSKAEDKDSITKAVIAEDSEHMDREIQENPLQVIEKNINEGRSKEIVKKESESKQETSPLCIDGIKPLNDSGKDSPRKELSKFKSQKPKQMENKEDNRKCITLTRKINTESGNGKAIGSGNSFPDDIFVEYVNGMPHMTVRLPSRNELCQFALKPISHNVGDLLSMLREEDRGIDRAAVINKNGVRIASSCTIDSLLDDTFSIQINNRTMEVNPPKRDKITLESMDKVGDVRKVIAQLYEAFNVGEYQLEKSNQLAKELESIRYELEPLEEKKLELSKKATRRTNFMTWMGLGLMSVQFGILARLTWWEYSWDIMEPVTYFVTYGTTMAMYAYYCVTKREYMMEAVKNREYSLTIYKNAKKMQFDVEHYNQLKRKTAELEYNLRRINDPLNMQLPSHLVRTQENTPPTDQQQDEAREGKSN